MDRSHCMVSRLKKGHQAGGREAGAEGMGPRGVLEVEQIVRTRWLEGCGECRGGRR